MTDDFSSEKTKKRASIFAALMLVLLLICTLLISSKISSTSLILTLEKKVLELEEINSETKKELTETQKYKENLISKYAGIHTNCIAEEWGNIANFMYQLNVCLEDCINDIGIDYSGRLMVADKNWVVSTQAGCTCEEIRQFLCRESYEVF